MSFLSGDRPFVLNPFFYLFKFRKNILHKKRQPIGHQQAEAIMT